ncbi:21692_t:CDS:2 [Gigaspora rosea]|nr:21692_t:CDS:2 [Gigaspora rosea]
MTFAFDYIASFKWREYLNLSHYCSFSIVESESKKKLQITTPATKSRRNGQQNGTKPVKKMPNNDTKGKESPPTMKKEVPNQTPNDEERSHRNRLYHDESKRSDTGNENHQYE